jgi:hypothetical protein
MMIENPEKRMPASQSELTRRIDWRGLPPFAVARGVFAAGVVVADFDPVALAPPDFAAGFEVAGLDPAALVAAGFGFVAAGFAAPGFAVPGFDAAGDFDLGGVGRRAAFIVALLSNPETTDGSGRLAAPVWTSPGRTTP